MSSPVRFAKIQKQLEGAGYRLVRVSSSHHIFERPGRPIISIPVHGKKVKPFYARQVEKIIAADKTTEGEGAGEQGTEGQESGPRGNGELIRPFAAAVLKQAQTVAGEYQIILSREEGHWYGRGLELPHVFGDGQISAKCIDSTREALTAAVAYMIEHGQTPPAPAKQGRRTTQVNVRLTAEERAILEGTARRKGFEGLSDFMRAAALESSR